MSYTLTEITMTAATTSTLNDQTDDSDCEESEHSTSSSSDSETEETYDTSYVTEETPLEKVKVKRQSINGKSETKAPVSNNNTTPRFDLLLSASKAQAQPQVEAASSGKAEEAAKRALRALAEKHGLIDHVPDLLLPSDENFTPITLAFGDTGKAIFEKLVIRDPKATGIAPDTTVAISVHKKFLSSLLRPNPHRDPRRFYGDGVAVDLSGITVVGVKLLQKTNKLGRTVTISSKSASFNTVPVVTGSMTQPKNVMAVIGEGDETLEKTVFSLPQSYITSPEFLGFWGRSVDASRLGVVFLDEKVSTFNKEVVAVRVATKQSHNKLWDFLRVNASPSHIVARHHHYKNAIYDCYDTAAFVSLWNKYVRIVEKVPIQAPEDFLTFHIQLLPLASASNAEQTNLNTFKYLENDLTYREFSVTLGVKWIGTYNATRVTPVEVVEAVSAAPTPSVEDIARAKNDDFHRALKTMK